ncbi:unnamed protein product, partial [Scytosiphon promiscuus]
HVLVYQPIATCLREPPPQNRSRCCPESLFVSGGRIIFTGPLSSRLCLVDTFIPSSACRQSGRAQSAGLLCRSETVTTSPGRVALHQMNPDQNLVKEDDATPEQPQSCKRRLLNFPVCGDCAHAGVDLRRGYAPYFFSY